MSGAAVYKCSHHSVGFHVGAEDGAFAFVSKMLYGGAYSFGVHNLASGKDAAKAVKKKYFCIVYCTFVNISEGKAGADFADLLRNGFFVHFLVLLLF